jgi:transcriptional regulator with XRE-family HTH domain
MKVEKNIKQMRELRNLTQAHVAEALKMSAASYSKLESGQTEITLTKIEQIAEVLGVDISTILNFDSNQILNFNIDQKESIGPAGYAFKPKNFSDAGLKELVEHLKSENEFLRKSLEQVIGNK